MPNNVLELRLKKLTGVTDGEILSTYLDMAKDALLHHMYPLATAEELSATEFPPCYETRQLQIAVYLVNRQGTEGEVENREGVITRRYESGNVPESMFEGIPRYAKPLG